MFSSHLEILFYLTHDSKEKKPNTKNELRSKYVYGKDIIFQLKVRQTFNLDYNFIVILNKTKFRASFLSAKYFNNGQLS